MSKKKKMSKKQLYAAVIHRAVELLKRPKGWTKDAYAKDKHGNLIELTDPIACSFCMDGALQRAYFDLTADRDTHPAINKVSRLMSFTGRPDMVQFNDASKTKKSVIERLQSALPNLEAA